MIDFVSAKSLIDEQILTLATEDVDVEHALGRICADEVFAPIDLPPFTNSAVDGYASYAGVPNSSSKILVPTCLRASAQDEVVITQNEAIKIMTGAPLPKGANAVVMKEDSETLGESVRFTTTVNPHDHVRFQGEDIKKGALVIAKGRKITASMIGLLHGLGIAQIKVTKLPSIRIISTGDELVSVGRPLLFGQVYYLMGPMLRAQCQELGVHDVTFEVVPDRIDAITEAITRAGNADILLITGGMSKGDYDLVRGVLSQERFCEIFFQGAWRPGKPLYFGRKQSSVVFGLPGNPVAAFVCFHVFVRPFILSSLKQDSDKLSFATARNSYEKKAGITFFARATVDENKELTFLAGQGSHQIFSLSLANAICITPEESTIVKASQVVQYYPLA